MPVTFKKIDKEVFLEMRKKFLENYKNLDDFDRYIKEYKGKKTLVWVIRGGIPQGLVIRQNQVLSELNLAAGAKEAY